ncbi:MAG TPA: dTMP kinase [Bacteroidota bacterium]|nr:dTMP kinase [Bacteroidota bacterium]
MRGRLIVFEGLDGAGKTTQIELLSKYLQERGLPVVVTSWNSSRLISKAIKRAKKAQLLTPYLYSTLHSADFMYRLENIILPALYDGFFVIADRYAYTALARDITRGVDRRWVENMYAFTPMPDIAFYCRTSIEKTLERVIDRSSGDVPSFYESGMDVIRHENPQEAFRLFQTRVAHEYDWICKEHSLIEIDTTESIESAHRYVVSNVNERLKLWEDDKDVHRPSYDSALSHKPSTIELDASEKELHNTFYGSLQPHRYSGKLIVLEGVDKMVSARQCNFLYNELVARGYQTRLALLECSWVDTEVTRKAMKKTSLSVSTKALIAVSEIALYYEQVILPALQSGAIVIMNGYLTSLFVKCVASGVQASWFQQLYEIFNIKPDLSIYIDTPLRNILSRKEDSLNKSISSSIEHIQYYHDEGIGNVAVQRRKIELYREIAESLKWEKVSQGGSQREFHQRVFGIVEKTILRHVKGPVPDESLGEVLNLFSRYCSEFSHARKVADLAVSIFDQTTQLHGYEGRARKLLYHAALLHDIGHALTDKKHEEMTYEAIMREQLKTLSETEKEIIANIACLHRLAYSKLNFEHLARLSGVNQLMVKRMASLLRIADALEESGKQVVNDVRCYEENGVLFVDLHAVSKALPERAAVLRKADMFEQVYNKSLVVARNWLEKRARKARRKQDQQLVENKN